MSTTPYLTIICEMLRRLLVITKVAAWTFNNVTMRNDLNDGPVLVLNPNILILMPPPADPINVNQFVVTFATIFEGPPEMAGPYAPAEDFTWQDTQGEWWGKPSFVPSPLSCNLRIVSEVQELNIIFRAFRSTGGLRDLVSNASSRRQGNVGGYHNDPASQAVDETSSIRKAQCQ